MTEPQVLPVTALIDDVIALLPGARVVLEAPPGAGKSTVLPLALLDAEALANQRILLLQPRRLAAISIANFLANQRGEAVGQSIGYHIRGEAKFTNNTRLLIVTEGMFTQYIQNDPELTGVGLVIFDEFHERNLTSDLGLAMALESANLREDLSLLIMSATLPAQAIADWLGDAHVLTSEGRQYPVDVSNHPVTAGQHWLQQLPSVIEKAMHMAQLGVLVFVPGQREIKQLCAQFEHAPNWDVLPLHRQIPLAEQKRIFSPNPSRRRLVIATNIAETSLTIPNIDVVVDSGRARQAQFYPQHGITRLLTRRISKASAMQRAGRAGRLGPGFCMRLWAKNDEHGMRAFQAPDLETADLTSLLLECRRWGAWPAQLKFFSQPNNANLAAADKLLNQLGISHDHGGLTAMGAKIAEFGAEPRVARILAYASEQSSGVRVTAAWLVAQIEQPGPAEAFPADVSRLVPAARQRFQYWCRRLQVEPAQPDATWVAELLLWGYSDRIAQQRRSGDGYLLSYGGGAVFHREDTSPRSAWLLVIDMMLSEQQTDAIIGAAITLNESDLNHPAVQKERRTEVRWQGPQQRLQAVQVEAIGAIVLSEKLAPTAISSADRLAALTRFVSNQVAGQGLDYFTLNDEAKQWLARARLYQSKLKPEHWPSFASAVLVDELETWAAPYWQDIDSLQKIKAWNPCAALQARLTYAQHSELNQACPEKLEVPSGRQVKIDYCAEQPLVAVKLQEMFGEPISPTVCHGKTTITIDLLSPAGRLLQRTGDLASFWSNAYQHVKKEMKGRYPKHPWPDDPRQAQATHKTKRQLK